MDILFLAVQKDEPTVMNEKIKAIPTFYKGYHFRSRLEAKWACFFDAVGISWLYEPEGFELPSGRYLPDFWLPDLGMWVEVKGRLPEPKYGSDGGDRDLARMRDLVCQHGSSALMVGGDPDIPGWWMGGEVGDASSGMSAFRTASFFMHKQEGPTVCIHEARYGDYNNQIDHCGNRSPVSFCDPLQELNDHKLMVLGIAKFRSARFEFGQSGASQ